MQDGTVAVMVSLWAEMISCINTYYTWPLLTGTFLDVRRKDTYPASKEHRQICGYYGWINYSPSQSKLRRYKEITLFRHWKEAGRATGTRISTSGERSIFIISFLWYLYRSSIPKNPLAFCSGSHAALIDTSTRITIVFENNNDLIVYLLEMIICYARST